MISVVEWMGVDPVSGRHLYLVPLTSLDAWPANLGIASEHFVLFLAADARATTDAALLTLALTTLQQGLAYLCAWGPDCARVEKIFDQAVVTTQPDEIEDSVVMTTSHPKETLDEALWYLLHVAFPAADYDETCRSVVAAAVASEEWASSIRNRLADPGELARAVEQREA
jgi:hypothetical protein